MGDVVSFTGITRLDLDANRVRDQIPDNMQGLVVMGYTEDGDYYFASSLADGAECVWLAEMLKKRLLEIADQD